MRVLPYVYKLTHKLTGQFYYGYRKANIFNSVLDIGVKYFTSSKYIEELGFHNFNYEVIAEFISIDKNLAGDHAYDLEQELIADNFENELCLNKHCVNKFNADRFKHDKPHSESAKNKMRLAKVGKKLSGPHKEKIRVATLGRIVSNDTISKKIGQKRSLETRINISASKIGKPLSESHKKSLSEAQKGLTNSKKHFKLISPDGIIFNDSNLAKFCREQKLTEYYINMAELCRGGIKDFMGWSGGYV